jgi:hypothetical protein
MITMPIKRSRFNLKLAISLKNIIGTMTHSILIQPKWHILPSKIKPLWNPAKSPHIYCVIQNKGNEEMWVQVPPEG